MAPATKETLTEVNERLDQLLLQIMDDLEALKEKRENLNSLIEQVCVLYYLRSGNRSNPVFCLFLFFFLTLCTL